MKKLILFALLHISFAGMGQNRDSTMIKQVEAQEMQLQSLKWQVDDLQAGINDLNNRTERFSRTTNLAALFYFGGLAVAAINAASNEPDDVVYYVAGGMALVGTVTLYFSGNCLRFKKVH